MGFKVQRFYLECDKINSTNIQEFFIFYRKYIEDSDLPHIKKCRTVPQNIYEQDLLNNHASGSKLRFPRAIRPRVVRPQAIGPPLVNYHAIGQNKLWPQEALQTDKRSEIRRALEAERRAAHMMLWRDRDREQMKQRAAEEVSRRILRQQTIYPPLNRLRVHNNLTNNTGVVPFANTGAVPFAVQTPPTVQELAMLSHNYLLMQQSALEMERLRNSQR